MDSMDLQCLGMFLFLEHLLLSRPKVKARFCDAFILIKEEIAQIKKVNADVQNKVLKGALHPPSLLMVDSWKKFCFPSIILHSRPHSSAPPSFGPPHVLYMI